MGPELLKLERSPGQSLADIVDTVGAAWNVDTLAMFGKDRHATIAAARVDVWRHLRAAGWSYPAIGRAFGRDHSTILQVLK
jgi:chromosomal replication initiation ATPase DnaA